MFFFFGFLTFISIQLVYGAEELSNGNGTIYTFKRKENVLGNGPLGEVIKGTKTFGNHSLEVAMKFERIRSTFMQTYVNREKQIYSSLTGHPSIPKYHDCLRDRQGNAVLIIELLGRSLLHYLKHFQEFSIKTTMLIGIQVLDIVEYMHSKGVVFNDIKPDNFAVGHDNSKKIYIFDFGMCQFYMEKGNHIKPESCPMGKGPGTGLYLSIYAHDHTRLSRRDDIESIAYMMIEFLQGKLPWKSRNLDKIRQEKENMSYEDIVGKKCTKTLVSFLRYARQLNFKDKPDYEYLKMLLQQELNKQNQTDMELDWTIKRPGSTSLDGKKKF